MDVATLRQVATQRKALRESNVRDGSSLTGQSIPQVAIAWHDEILRRAELEAFAGRFQVSVKRTGHPVDQSLIKRASQVVVPLLENEGFTVSVLGEKEWEGDGRGNEWVYSVSRTITASWE